ncbi:PREDICTED: uncharacterized protein LOC104824112 isoform X3 [Tarenaya hassleriana]|uniref:uncharacterized protein LOC104824112 isoform X3 n=1 Tax=Tarenaya hassleriana TaxID=28532 RepID=UPI00053C1907|nr:PREDICTED: uncharacterized protein LOC104824112 isoform X3 [Tarenaya hassleriana]
MSHELLHSSLPTWDLHNLGSVFDRDSPIDTCEIVGESPEKLFGSPEIEFSGVSTGYLEDALIEFSERSKRRRLSLYFDDQAKVFDDVSQNYWDLPGHYSCMSSQLASPHGRTGNGESKKKRRVVTRVVYPFALVKPGGREEDVTLNDINERILMRPTRPVRHPVGDFACRPCLSARRLGPSGKAVVALTRIQTQGRGTITIIRTKG